MSESYEVAIIGGGIVGLASARALVQAGAKSIVVLEAEEQLASHQTGHNSGVIHAGLYYKPGSLKAENCAAGRTALYAFCKEFGVPHEQCGKVVVATSDREIPALDELECRGKANGLDGIKRLDRKGLLEYEPHATGVAALHVPHTGIVDFGAVARVYAEHIRAGGGQITMGWRLKDAYKERDGFVLESSRGEVHAKYVINCAGLQCDRVARMFGAEPDLRIIPFRGEYYELVQSKHDLVRNLIYPVPDPRFPFLGVHFTRMVHGGVEAGPNAVLALAREGYSWKQVSVSDIFDWLGYSGFWRMAGRYGATGMGEVVRSLSKGAFVRALQKLVPDVGLADVTRAGAGVRAQAVTPDGKLVDDFRILEDERVIHVLNAPSPAATASLSIGNTISELANRNFGLSS